MTQLVAVGSRTHVTAQALAVPQFAVYEAGIINEAEPCRAWAYPPLPDPLMAGRVQPEAGQSGGVRGEGSLPPLRLHEGEQRLVSGLDAAGVESYVVQGPVATADHTTSRHAGSRRRGDPVSRNSPATQRAIHTDSTTMPLVSPSWSMAMPSTARTPPPVGMTEASGVTNRAEIRVAARHRWWRSP